MNAYYDVAIILVILVSVLMGFMRGGAREIITLFGLVGGVLAAGLLLPFTGPLFRRIIHPEWVGTVLALLLVFVLAYALIHWLAAVASRRLRQSEELGGVDRTLGGGFGLVRALVIIGAFHLGFAAITPANRLPPWFHHAKLYWLSADAAKTIQTFLPRVAKVADAVAPKVEQSIRTGASDKSRPAAKAAAYDRRQRDNMDALVEKSR
jgi:membrane protein required for colicin V production